MVKSGKPSIFLILFSFITYQISFILFYLFSDQTYHYPSWGLPSFPPKCNHHAEMQKLKGKKKGWLLTSPRDLFRLYATPRTAACQASLSITNSWSLLKLVPIESVMPSNHLILCRKELYTTEQLNWTEDLFTPLLKSFLLSAPGNKLGMSSVTINWEGVFIF